MMADNTQSTTLNKELLVSVLAEQFEAFEKKELGVPREILNGLGPLVKSSQIMVITGLRRVGKSTLLAQIAARYFKKNYFYVNFEDERLLGFRIQDFDLLHETLISLFGDKKTILFDEIQNVAGWERFVRRLHDLGYKLIITGSNASLLSQELGTRLTGRYIRVELFPFSFREYLKFKELEPLPVRVLTTGQRGRARKLLNNYLSFGGIPDALKYPKLDIYKTLYDDVLYRDIATRYGLENVMSLKELAMFLLSNTASMISFNKLKDQLKLGSVNTVKSYIHYLENSWLFFILNKYAYSVKEQQIASKKVYGIDTGLIRSVGFSFSRNQGKLMENAVFLALRQKKRDFYYYKTALNEEVDFFLPRDQTLIQVTRGLDETNRERELGSMLEAGRECKNIKKYLVISESTKENIVLDDIRIQVIPLYEWLLEN